MCQKEMAKTTPLEWSDINISENRKETKFYQKYTIYKHRFAQIKLSNILRLS